MNSNPQKWEYFVTNQRDVESSLEIYLNQMGDQGWELVQKFDASSHNWTMFIFKRLKFDSVPVKDPLNNVWMALYEYNVNGNGLPQCSAMLLKDLRTVLREWNISFEDVLEQSKKA